MAKIIKCPTCAAPIPVSPQSIGQVIKCPGCGKGIKLVARKSGSSSPGASLGGSSAGSRNTSSMSGSMNETYRSITGEPALQDDPPAMAGGCARCGKLVDEADLVEEQGELICKECAIAAAGERHAGQGPIDYAPPAYVPSRRAKIINFTPMFFVFCFFALLYGGTQLYLTMAPPPTGTKVVAKNSAPKPHAQPAAPATAPAESPATEPAEAPVLQPTENPATGPAVTASASEADRESHNNQAIQQKRIRLKALKPTEFTPAPATTAPSETAIATVEHPAATESASAPRATDPVLLGFDELKEKKYAEALQILDDVRGRVIRADQPSLSDRQKTILEGIAAAAIGVGRPERGRFSADLAYRFGDRSRSLVLNRAQEHLAARTNANDLAPLSMSVKAVMESNKEDELAANIFGTILERLSGMSIGTSRDRATLESFHAYLVSYNEQLAKNHPGQAKWGIEWLPAEDVKNYRLVEGTTAAKSVVGLWNKVGIDKVRASFLTSQIEQGQRVNRDVSKLQAELDETKRQLETDKATANAMKHSYYPPQWLEDFQPVLPDEN